MPTENEQAVKDALEEWNLRNRNLNIGYGEKYVIPSGVTMAFNDVVVNGKLVVQGTLEVFGNITTTQANSIYGLPGGRLSGNGTVIRSEY